MEGDSRRDQRKYGREGAIERIHKKATRCKFTEAETHYGRVKKERGGQWGRTRWTYKTKASQSLRNHLAMAHSETPRGTIRSPNCDKLQNT